MIESIKLEGSRFTLRDSLGNVIRTFNSPNEMSLTLYGDNPNLSDLNKILNRMFDIVPSPEKVIFNDPATIVYWSDKTKTVVKCGEGDIYDKEKGLALCYMKKMLGNKGNYNDTLKKWCGESEPSVYWIKGKEFYKCSKCGCEVIHPVLKCPKCESKILEVKNGR